MKKHGIINSEISSVLSYMGHTDQICIADSGLPIPNEVKRIDVALEQGVPRFIDVLKVVLEDMYIERIYLAIEIVNSNPSVYQAILELAGDEPIEFVSHAEFKQMTKQSKAIIRTGEITPYANIILQSKVNF